MTRHYYSRLWLSFSMEIWFEMLVGEWFGIFTLPINIRSCPGKLGIRWSWLLRRRSVRRVWVQTQSGSSAIFLQVWWMLLWSVRTQCPLCRFSPHKIKQSMCWQPWRWSRPCTSCQVACVTRLMGWMLCARMWRSWAQRSPSTVQKLWRWLPRGWRPFLAVWHRAPVRWLYLLATLQRVAASLRPAAIVFCKDYIIFILYIYIVYNYNLIILYYTWFAMESQVHWQLRGF